MPTKYSDLKLPDKAGSLTAYSLVVLAACAVPALWFNTEIFQYLNSKHSPLLDSFWLGCTTMGDGYLVAVVLGCFLIYNPRITFVGLLTLCISSAMVHAIKAAMPLPRPVEVLDSVHVIGPLLRFGTFPSGHSAAGMSLAITLAGFSSRPAVKLTVINLGLLIALSRVFVGAHFPRDIIVGMGLAVLAFGMTTHLFRACIQDRVWSAPAWNSRRFQAFYYVELIAVLGAIFVYGPFLAESPITAIATSTVILVVALRAHPTLFRRMQR